jgi:uncharacterized OB-fold protein
VHSTQRVVSAPRSLASKSRFRKRRLSSLYTYTVVGRATAKGFPNVPYAVGFVALDAIPHVRITGILVDVDPLAVAIGMSLEGRFVAAGPEREMTLIHWAPAHSKKEGSSS